MVEDPKGTKKFSCNEIMGDVTRGAQYHNTWYSGIPGSLVLDNTTYSDIKDIDTNKENNSNEASTNDANMGCQCQTRKGAIKAAKAAAAGHKTKHKRYKQQSL